MSQERALKALRYLRKHAEVTTDGGWSLERERRRLDKGNLTLTFRYVVDHHQADGRGRIYERTFNVLTASDYARQFHNRDSLVRDGGKLEFNVYRNGKPHKLLCNPDDHLLFVDHRNLVANCHQTGKELLAAVNFELHYDGGC